MSRRWYAYAALFLILAGVFFLCGTARHAPAEVRGVAMAALEPAAAQTENEPSYPVVRVIDGDTIVIAKDGANLTVRLIGLDTPEIVDPRKPVQCFGRESSVRANELLDGTRVRIELDPSQGTLDKYGRTLAYVYLPDGTSFNKLMIEEGFGHEYTYRLPYAYQKEFKATERGAHESKRGLWADDACADASGAVSPRPAVL